MDRNYSERILVVDDDPNLLAGVRRQLRGQFDISTAEGARDGLKMLQEEAPFAVVMSDMRMPEMNGVQFLAQAHEICPDTVRIMLTGNADLETAMQAVNEGSIFRFLVKPCHKTAMEKALEAAIEQHRLIVAERELLEKTLNGSVQVLADILSLVSPVAFSHATRASRYVKQIVADLGLSNAWQYELATLLSQVGYITLPSDTRAKIDVGDSLSPEEARAAESHPQTGCKLLSKIPRLEVVAKIIAGQNMKFSEYAVSPDKLPAKPEATGAMILKAALDFDSWLSQGFSNARAIGELKRNEFDYHPLVLQSLKQVKVGAVELQVRRVKARELNDTMILAEEIRTRKGMLVAAKGQPVSQSMRALLQNFFDRGEIDNDLHVLMPGANVEQPEDIEAAVADS